MKHMAIFSATLGLSHPWRITAADFARDSKRLDITIEYAKPPLDCPFCGGHEPGAPAKTCVETWYHEDFFRYTTYLHAKVPLMTCDCGVGFPKERPWSRAGSKFARLSSSNP